MPREWYFITGDLIANGVTGIIAALACYWLVNPGWSMFMAMLAAMALGMFVALLTSLLVFMRYFGAMEVMVPVMQSGMWAGMIVGMRASMAPLTFTDSWIIGLLTGLAVTGLCWAVNTRLQGKVSL